VLFAFSLATADRLRCRGTGAWLSGLVILGDLKGRGPSIREEECHGIAFSPEPIFFNASRHEPVV
jgi:hypothetical protein